MNNFFFSDKSSKVSKNNNTFDKCTTHTESRDFKQGVSFRCRPFEYGVTYHNDDFVQDFVIYKGSLFMCLSESVALSPGESPDDWTLVLNSGDNGVPGPQGEPGKPGIDGKSAYQIWLDAGNEGTIEDFLEYFRGYKGEQGIQGEQGIPGIPGEKGTDGIDGVGIESIIKTSGTGENGTSDTYTIYLSNGETFDFYVTHGQTGQQGPQGIEGPAGKDGASVTIRGTLYSISELDSINAKSGDGYLIGENLWIYNGSEYPNSNLEFYHNTINDTYWLNVGAIKGPKGDKGQDGQDGKDAPIPEFKINSNGHLIYVVNGSATDLGNVVGQDGTNAEVEYKIPSFKVEDGHLWVFVKNVWTDLGSVAGPQGPQGEQGPRGFIGDTGAQGPKGEPGRDGIDGKDGQNGVGIAAITLYKDGGPGEVDIYNIHLTDDRFYQFSVYNGKDGAQGVKGEVGPQGEVGPKGDKGDRGEKGEKGDKGLSLNMKSSVDECRQINDCYLDNEGCLQVLSDITGEGWLAFVNVGKIVGPKGDQGIVGDRGPQGPKGDTGDPGKDGDIGPQGQQGVGITSITHSGNAVGIAGTMDTYFINLSNGEQYPFIVTNGADGNHIMFGNGDPENITEINSNLNYIFNPCGYIEEEDISRIIGNKGDVYINLIDGSVFEYTSSWELKGAFQTSGNIEQQNLDWEDIGF